MKSKDYLKTLAGKDAAGLRAELEALRREQFNLRMQQATGKEVRPHLFSQVRRNIARVKTLLNQQARSK